MTKYVTRKHGIVLGSGNHFFVVDAHHPEGVEEVRDGYRAIVDTQSYRFDQINILNAPLRTPAEQMLWAEGEVDVHHEFQGIASTHQRRVLTLSTHFRMWLEKNVGPLYDAWDTYTWIENSPAVFFKRRGDALKFAQEVERHLVGMRFAG